MKRAIVLAALLAGCSIPDDRFFKPGAYLPTHAEHMAVWH